MGQEEESFAPVRRADVGRSEQIPFDIAPERGKVGQDVGEPKRKVSGDVFAEEESGAALAEDAQDFGPQVSLVIGSASRSGARERLARVAAHDEIHRATPGSSVEGSKVTPDRSIGQLAALHRRDQTRGRECFPLDVADCASRSNALESQVDPTDPGAQTEGT